MVSSVDQVWVSRFTSPTFALLVHRDGVPGPADDDQVSFSLFTTQGGVAETLPLPTWPRVVNQNPASPGQYEISLSSVDTQTMGDYELRADYLVNGVDEIYVWAFVVGPPAEDYDALTGGWKDVVDNTWLKFADLFDSPYGGPNLQVYIQTHFGRNRLAQLLPDAMSSLNTAAMGHSSYTVGAENFDFASWAGLLQDSLYIETLKHLIRSYVEQPEAILGTAVSRLDRRDYMQRWQEVLTGELADFNRDLSRYRMSQLPLGNVHVLVSGGAFGTMGPYVNAGGAGEAAARGYFAVRRWH